MPNHAKRRLEGIKVVDLTSVVMGPTATRLLADYGVTVIKIESQVRPDSLRNSTPYKGDEPGLNRGGYFAMYNAGKLSLTLNMRLPKARAFFKQHLVPWADVIMEAYAPRVAEEWGITYDELSRINPSIIMLRACLMGHTGPHRDLKGFGQFTAAQAGRYELTGWPDREPVGPYSAYSDFISWNYCLVAVLSALDHRRRTGQGQYIDQSLFESTIHFLAPTLLDFAANGVEATRMGNWDPYAAPHGAYRCQGDDRWCAIAVTSEGEWHAFGEAIGSPEWTKDPRFSTLPGRKEHEAELDRLVEAWTSLRPAKEVMEILQEAGVPAGVVQNAKDLFEDPQFQHREAFVVRDHPEMGPHHIFTSSFRLSETPGVPHRAAPCLGQDNEYVCKELLGIPEEELANWIANEVLE